MMGSSQSAQPEKAKVEEDKVQQPDTAAQVADNDEPDEWDKRIFSTGCSEENAKMTDCYFEKKDWRACASEMQQFKECWKRHGNEERTSTKDALPPSSISPSTLLDTNHPGAFPITPVQTTMNASRTALSQGQRQLRSSGRLATRSLTALSTRFWSASSTPAAPSKTIPPAPKVSSVPDAAAAAKPTPSKPAPSKPAAAKPFSKPYSTSSNSKPAASAAIPSDLFYQPTTVAHAEETADDDAAIPAVDWSASFHGISSRPVSQRQFAALMRPLDVDDIEVKPDGIIYLPEIRYRRRLNEAFGPMGWGLIPKGEAVVGDSVVTREYALIVDGRFVSQAQGENSYFGADQLPSAVEGCKSNALMRCCKDLGIASELWDPSFVRWFKKNRMEEVWVEHATTKKKRTLWYRKGAVDVAYPYRQTK